MNLSSGEFDRINGLIYAYAGIRIGESRIDYVGRRVHARTRALDLETVRDYLRYLSFDRTGREMDVLIGLVVVNETCFFRDYPQLKLLSEEVLPEVVGEKGRSRKLGVLSAGCSTGEEPYTLAIILREMLDDPDGWTLRIDAVDISANALEKAREGLYRDHALRETPYVYRDRYFTREGDLNRLSPDIGDMVEFSRVNLYDRAQMSRLFAYDIVLCRNVLIYFDPRSAGEVMAHLYGAMNPGAFIFLGAVESVGRVSGLFRKLRMGNAFVYRK